VLERTPSKVDGDATRDARGKNDVIDERNARFRRPDLAPERAREHAGDDAGALGCAGVRMRPCLIDAVS
jgi:hypothetical protein